MDAGQYSKGQTVPPLMSMVTLGSLQYTDAGQPVPIKVDIQGNIDKGFFEADGDWTCYRRNYFSCVCSYSLSPWLPSSSIQFVQSGGQTYTVLDFYMCISAVVAENDSQKIELVQHTPKRDKGPTEEPKKIRMQPKTLQHHSMFSHDGGLGGSRMGYGAPDPYGNGQAGGECLTEHTFERIQFKQATANNGKRRAAQQYYHLVIELWANVGPQAPDSFVKVAYRKSAKMIVRGRSPGHYQGERHKSTSSGPGGGSTGMPGYPGGMMNADFGAPGGNMLGGGYGGGDYARNNNPYGGAQRHHHDLGLEPLMQADDPKVLDSHKSAYLYFDGPISEATQHHHHQQHQHQHHNHNHNHQHQHQPDGRGTVDMFTHQSSSSNGTGGRGGGAGAGVPPDGILPHMTTTTSTTLDSHREGVKRDPESGLLPSLFQPGPHSHRCSPFSAKTTSEGYYPSMMLQPGVSLT
ncbi:hypothetical protein B0T11DRAFT_6344 [Plectosphaerella cucumerina]|uniref:NDT80 domain-containing protein n=1 Tax=Plectosphaerella cucumerina TaxID=40658 RepID=A0A8K0TRH5_9PEZI|nr:hypothetical protein B0T11DRAFT_6344 [Plectosphaerella cucumerina]